MAAVSKDPYRYFLPEARDLVRQLGQGVLDLERGSGGAETVQRLLRLAHTLKGAARVVKQREVADRAHAIEDALAPFRESSAPVPPERIQALLQLIDEMGARLSGLAAPTAPQQTPSDGGLQTLRAAIADIDLLLDGVAESRAQLASLRGVARTIDRVRDVARGLSTQLMLRASRSRPAAADAGARATAQELEQLIDRVQRQLTSGLDQVDRELRQLHHATEQLRLVPAGTMFPVLERAARDAADVLKKRVVFEGSGGDVRVEAHVLSAVQRAAVQVVRNAVAHGIEAEPVRQAHGKPPAGIITLHVVRRGRSVVFRIRDDGRGVDLEAVRRVAVERGAAEADVRTLDADALMRMLLHGGISTSRDVTAVAGRGIGLDVVREVAETLGGSVSVVSAATKGTTFELVTPVSLAAIEALMVEAGGVSATIPLDAVRHTAHVTAAEISRSPRGESLLYDGRVIPFAPLANALRMPRAAEAARPRRPVVVVEGANGLAGIGVDRCRGAERIVVRPLPGLMAADAVTAGLYLDAEGNPQLVLDPDALVDEASRETALGPVAAPARPLPLLVIDDSLTTRMLEQSILESAGYEVDAVTSAEEALVSARRKAYGLFLVDVEMPGMDGFTFVERVRADPALRGIPALLITSRSSADDRQRGLDAGAQGYIVKGEFDQADLLARIKRLVG